MAKVTCTNIFFDIETNANRVVGESWEVETDRANKLNTLNLVEIEFIKEVVAQSDKSIKPSFKKK